MYRRQEKHIPNSKIVNNWKENTRLKKRSILKVEKKLQEKHKLPEQRKPETFAENNPNPCMDRSLPTIHFDLTEKLSKKSTDVIDLQRTGLQTIQMYPDDCIHVYTDGSASQGTVNAGYGARIEFDNSSSKFHWTLRKLINQILHLLEHLLFISLLRSIKKITNICNNFGKREDVWKKLYAPTLRRH